MNLSLNKETWATIVGGVLLVMSVVAVLALLYQFFPTLKEAKKLHDEAMAIADSIGPGSCMPEFTLATLSGQTVSSKELLGKIVVLNFWATWCGPCRQELPILQHIESSISRDDVLFYAINTEGKPETVRNFIDDTTLSLPVLMDEEGQVAEKFGVISIPRTFVIDKTGKVRFVHRGFSNSLGLRLKAELEELFFDEQIHE